MEPPLPQSSIHEKEKMLFDFSPLSWNNFFDRKEQLNIDGDLFNVYFKGNQGPVFYLLHGGGYTGLTWCCFTEQLSAKIECRIIAPDLRGHGESVTKDADDLSTQRQTQDINNIYTKIFASAAPPLIVVGHSMGGALAVHVVNAKLLPNVMAMAVIDVVEGSALSALSAMPSFLKGRPQHFSSLEKAVSWCLQSGTTINHRAARVSMPSQLQQVQLSEQQVYVWRTNLYNTQPHWNGWFQGLSQKFLDCAGAKILLLANVESLDKKMMTGQMKGMFQTEVLPKVGHAVHEDSPEKVAQIFVNLVNRYKVLFDKATS